MNQYLTAIGFGDIESKKELYEILTQVEDRKSTRLNSSH